MPRFSDAFLDELRSRINLEDLVSEYVPLKQKGRRFWGCCPFHNEKTPSFSVDSEAQMYYCFGCHKGGTAINFVRDIERMEFSEAVEFLAEKAHMAIPEAAKQRDQSQSNSAERERIYEANLLSARYYHSMLWTNDGAPMLDYFYKRGLNDSDIKHFGLGAAPNGWDNLLKYLTSKGFEEELLVKAGLVTKKDGKYYDMFRNRAMFPIINAQGRILGFGGRILGDAKPKYLNTSDTPVFNKKQGLYAINFAKNERTLGHLILVEGYMDTVSLRKHGVGGVVATLGTALTEEQAKLFKRYTSEVWISYDGDGAGQKAALRALDIFDQVDGITASVIDYPAGQDPDDFIRSRGLKGFEQLKRFDPTEYRMLRARDDLDMSTQDGLTQYTIRCCDILRKVKNPIVMENNLRALVNQTGYDREILIRQIGNVSQNSNKTSFRGRRIVSEKVEKQISGAECALITMLAKNVLPAEMISIDDFSVGINSRLAAHLLSGKNAVSFVDDLEDDNERNLAAQALNYSPIPEDREDRLVLAENCIMSIRKERQKSRMEQIQDEIKTASPERKAELYKQLQDIMNALEK